jgi:prophage regulatory protein
MASGHSTGKKMNQNQIKTPIVILRPAQVAEKKGISRTGQFELLQAGDFPKPIKLSGARSIGFIESEIDDWIEKRMAARDEAKGGAK